MAGTVPHCSNLHHHVHQVEEVRGLMPLEEELYDLSELFKVFGDSTRMKILYALFERELCVCELGELLGISVSGVSHQLRVLKQASLVKFRRSGKTVYYSLSDSHVRSILDQGMEHIRE